ALEDPFTSHSRRSPRGRPGDAVLVDFALGVSVAEAPNPRAAAIHRYLLNEPVSRAIRDRRQFAARLIDETAGAQPGARVLSIGCGHARELEISAAAREGRLGAIVGVDEDRGALDVAARAYARLGFAARHAEPRAFLASQALKGFDLVYAVDALDSL